MKHVHCTRKQPLASLLALELLLTNEILASLMQIIIPLHWGTSEHMQSVLTANLYM